MNIKSEILNCKILIVEDDYLGRAVLREIFKKQGFINIEEAENGKEGLEKTFSQIPDLIILDVVMPEMDGIECCKQIRASDNPEIADIPIIFQTALDRIADKNNIFDTGATDYVTKPIDPHEITSRVVIHLERTIITKRLREFNTRVARELEVARMAQQMLIPNQQIIRDTEKEYRLQICGHYQSCSELGGDFWGLRSISSEELAIYMVDFSGHGVNAALNVFRLHAIMQSTIDNASSPSKYVTNINSILNKILPRGQFATMFYGIINLKRGTLCYTAAASPSAVLLRAQGTSYQILESTGTLLGALQESTYHTNEVKLDSGDCLLLYSDALTETTDTHGKIQPIENWMPSFQKFLKIEKNGCKKSFANLLSDFEQKCGKNLHDDLTLAAFFRM